MTGEGGLLTRLLGPKHEEETGGWRKCRKDGPRNNVPFTRRCWYHTEECEMEGCTFEALEK